MVEKSGYPGVGYRLKLVWEELTDASAGLDSVGSLEKIALQNSSPAITNCVAYLNRWKDAFSNLDSQWTAMSGSSGDPLAEDLDRLAEGKVKEAVPRLAALVREVIPSDRAYSAPQSISHLIDLVAARIPPFQAPLAPENLPTGIDGARFGDVLTATLIYEVGIARGDGTSPQDLDYQSTCALAFKAIDLDGAKQAIEALAKQNEEAPRRERGVVSKGGAAGLATGPFILEALTRQESSERLTLVPYFGDQVVGSGSCDLHLGTWFRIAKRTRHTEIDLANKREKRKIRDEAQSEVYVKLGDKFVLHPGDFALGITLEYVSLPGDLMAYVEGKSSLGRAGLLIATATQVAPGFKGCVVLELANTGTVPLVLRPGMRIAQLVLLIADRKLTPEWLYDGEFTCQVKP
jgi:dCTP deaminase